MKQLFLSHYSGHAGEVSALARELRFRGVRPWVDKQGGYLIADESATAAERAICQDCLGLLLYATEDVFGRTFIREHEIPPALRMRTQDQAYLLFAVPRNLDFEGLRARSCSAFGADLSKYHTRPVSGSGSEAQFGLGLVATDVATKILQLADLNGAGELCIQFSTREVAPSADEESLTIDGTEAYAENGHAEYFAALIEGLRELKRSVSNRFARPRLLVHGFKHLSAAFLFGRVFQPFSVSVRQTPSEYWKLQAAPEDAPVLDANFEPAPGSNDVVVQISSGFKDLSPAVDRALSGQSFNRLVIRPGARPLKVDERICATMIRDAYSAIDLTVSQHHTKRILLFAAAPQAFMMGLGQRFAGMPETLVFDFDGNAYLPAKTIAGGVL